MENYVKKLEEKGYKVHYPPRDTNQKDPNGYYICLQNREAIVNADEVHIYWNGKSSGSKFDFGMVFMVNYFTKKPIVIINKEDVKKTPYKSFENVLLTLEEKLRD